METCDLVPALASGGKVVALLGNCGAKSCHGVVVQIPDYTLDAERLATLKKFGVLDSSPEIGFEDIVSLAAQICETPVALVSFVAEDRQWFKARVGFEPCETGLSSSVCAYALVEPDILIIEDLSVDPRTQNNPLVTGAPRIRFYGGAPLRAANGAVLGSLCVIDSKPRPQGLTASQADGLRNLARQVISQLELRLAITERDALLVASQRAQARRQSLLLIGDQLRALGAVPQMTRAASEIVGRTIDVIRAGFARIDPSNEFLEVEADWSASGFASRAGRYELSGYDERFRDLLLVSTENLVINDVLSDPRTEMIRDHLTAIGVRALAKLPVRDRQGGVTFFFAHSDRPRDWLEEDLSYLHNVGDRVAEGVARAGAEALQQVLNLELNHRMKNTFAMVQAIAHQTLRVIPDQAPVQTFTARVLALSNANDALINQNWATAMITDIIARAVAIGDENGRFNFSGPQIVIGPRAALSLSLILHELATNAMKFGALSQPSGRVDIAWRTTGDKFTMIWREIGGPVAVEPKRKGFGSRLIGMGLSGAGGVQVRYLPTGFEADFEASLARLQDVASQ